MIRSKRYMNTVWNICNSYEDYKQFAKNVYRYKGGDYYFGGGEFKLEEETWFGEKRKGDWMDTFRIPYVKDNPQDEDSDEFEIGNPFTDEYEIGVKPEDCEYPVIIRYCLDNNCLDWCSLTKLSDSD